MAVFSIDYSGLGSVNPYLNSEFTNYGNPLKLANGIAMARDSNGQAYTYHNAALATTGNLEASVEVNFSSSNFKLVSVTLGFINTKTLTVYGIKIRFNTIALRKVEANGNSPTLNAATTGSYTGGDIFTVKIDRASNPVKLRSYLNGAQLDSVNSPITDFTDYRLGYFVHRDNTDESQGVTAFDASGLVIAAPNRIATVGTSNSLSQYKKAVPVTVEGLNTVDLTAVSFGGIVCPYAVTSATAFTFDAPGNLASGTYATVATFAAVDYSKTAAYVQTHPLKVPDSGTSVHIDSVLAQIGNPNNARYLRIAKPAGLTWKSPHSAFTVDNIALDVSELFAAPVDADIGASYQAPASIIDDTGAVTDFNIEWTVQPADNPQGFKIVILPTYQSVYDKVAI